MGLAGDVGEPLVGTLVAVGEAAVVEAEEVEESGLEVVDVDRVGGGCPADLVGFAVGGAGFAAAAGEEGGEGVGVVVAAGDVAAAGTVFAEGGAAELGEPGDEGLVEEAAVF